MKRYFWILIFTVGIYTVSYSQYRSLLSANGDGRRITPVFSMNKLSGELSAAYTNGLICNMQNPASYADAYLTSLEFAIRGESGSNHYKDSITPSGGVGISHFSMLLPMKVSKSGLAIGMYQKSDANYSVISYQNDSTFGQYTNRNYGNGGVYQAFLGMGFNVKNFKFGYNIMADFGSIEKFQETQFDDTTNSYLPILRGKKHQSVFGMSYGVGAQYDLTINKKNAMTFGAYYNGNFFERASYTSNRFTIYENNSSTRINTAEDTTGKEDFPTTSKFGIGVMYINKSALKVGAEFNMEDFTKQRDVWTGKNLQRAWHTNFGVEYYPALNRDVDKRKFFNRTVYRGGLILGKSEQNYTNTFNDVKVTGGISIPVASRNVAFITLGASYQLRGFGSENTVTESLFTFVAAISFSDKWFIKRKFD